MKYTQSLIVLVALFGSESEAVKIYGNNMGVRFYPQDTELLMTSKEG